MSKKRGLWDNIHAKRKRIKQGSGERMRRPGEKGRPTAADFKASQANEEMTATSGEVRGMGYVSGDPAAFPDAIQRYVAGNVVDSDQQNNQLFKKVKEVHGALHSKKTAYEKRTQKESVEMQEATNPAAKRVKLIKRVLKPAHDSSKHFKTKETVEPQSRDSDDPDSRFDATDSAVRIYKKDTPGQ
jgi:hypothetical protein